ncbi:glucose-6-phosphate isomerase [Candidatus Uhrbacteria bacterium]|nr:glucose-6-phosphate isomerase [Candidatus Uhrbacteria bacterium]
MRLFTLDIELNKGKTSEKVSRALERSVERFRIDYQENRLGFFELPADRSSCALAQHWAKETPKDITDVLLIGIGGSDLGVRMLCQALQKTGAGKRLHFLSAPDPDSVSEILSRLDWRRTLVNVVSKSGNTLEPISLLLAIWPSMKKTLGKRAKERVVVTTEEQEKSKLFCLAKEEGFRILPFPPSIGGRFSALALSSLYPAALAGIDIRGLLSGAKAMMDDVLTKTTYSLPAQYAAAMYAAIERGGSIHVCMPYAARLDAFAVWYRQLWAESLGKTVRGKRIGPTPIAGTGPVDQHSQLQLYQDGPQDKVITFIEIDRWEKDMRLAFAWKNMPLDGLAGTKLSTIMKAERLGVAEALHDAGCPTLTITIPTLNAFHLGSLCFFYEVSVVLLGYMLGVDPFDQPGVEAAKRATAKRLLTC